MDQPHLNTDEGFRLLYHGQASDWDSEITTAREVLTYLAEPNTMEAINTQATFQKKALHPSVNPRISILPTQRVLPPRPVYRVLPPPPIIRQPVVQVPSTVGSPAVQVPPIIPVRSPPIIPVRSPAVQVPPTIPVRSPAVQVPPTIQPSLRLVITPPSQSIKINIARQPNVTPPTINRLPSFIPPVGTIRTAPIITIPKNSSTQPPTIPNISNAQSYQSDKSYQSPKRPSTVINTIPVVSWSSATTLISPINSPNRRPSEVSNIPQRAMTVNVTENINKILAEIDPSRMSDTRALKSGIYYSQKQLINFAKRLGISTAQKKKSDIIEEILEKRRAAGFP